METPEEMPSNGQQPNMESPSPRNEVGGSSPSEAGEDIGVNDSNVSPEPAESGTPVLEAVWEMILDNLTDDEDRMNCCKAYPLFDRVLTRSKPVWMFKQILRFVYRALVMKDKLTCRRICRQWRTDIDHIIRMDNLNPQWYSFSTVEKIDSFTQKFDGHPTNPFIDRTVSINNRDEAHEDEFHEKILALFSTFGKYVWTLDFEWNNPNPQLRFFWNIRRKSAYLCLQQVLTQTPNLKQFIFFGSGGFEGYAVDRNDVDDQILSRNMTENPLPSIPTVESLELHALPIQRLPDAIINTLVSPYAPHLKYLGMKWGCCDQVFSHHFPTLTYIELNQVPNDQGMEKLLLVKAPLEELAISGPAADYDEGTILSISGLLRIFNCFPLLEGVDIYDVVDTRSDITYLTNSTVRQLTLEFLDDNDHWHSRLSMPASFNFLQAFKALQYLYVSLRSAKESYLGLNEGEGEVQLYKIILEENQLYESNIWTLIPSLETVSIYCSKDKKRIVGERREFERHQAFVLAI